MSAPAGPDPAIVARIREICLAMPESVERETWGHPTFRVREKIFASCGSDDGAGATVMTMKAPPGEQESLLAEGHPFFLPKYVGSKGWVGIVIDDGTAWDEVAELVQDSFRQIAPRRLVVELDADR